MRRVLKAGGVLAELLRLVRFGLSRLHGQLDTAIEFQAAIQYNLNKSPPPALPGGSRSLTKVSIPDEKVRNKFRENMET